MKRDEADQIYIVDHGESDCASQWFVIKKSQYASNILKVRFKEMKDLESYRLKWQKEEMS